MPDSKSRILVVEDQAIVAIDIQSQLESLGYTVVGIAASAGEACEKAASLAPDLVLMDVHLDDAIDGIDAAAKIRERQGIPIVFLTAYVDSATIRRAQQVEPYGYIVKPFGQRDLHTTLQMALYKGEIDRRLKRSREDLLAILDAQRQGTILLDRGGKTSYASRAALNLLSTTADSAAGQPWRELLRVSPEQQSEIEAMLANPVGERDKVVAALDRPRQPRAMIEIEAQDDPRDPAGRILFLYDVSQLYDLRRMLDGKAQFENIIGKSAAIEQVWQLIRDFGRVESTVLIEGETGVGKELVARAIHNQSRRSDQPFVALNCAGLSDELAASQLFGHRRGAFTGAVDDQPGLFESAQGGTLFLDEIGDLPMRIQTTLLRVLEDRQIMRLGESRTRPVDVRIVTASNRDLGQEVAEQRFRADLLYRIRVARIRIPPLRERREDIPLLIRAFLAMHSATTGHQVDQASDEALRLLLSHSWPGNVRELKNALEFAVIRCRGSVLQASDLPPEVVADMCADAILESLSGDDRSRLLGALERAGGNRTEAAALLGISRATLYRRLAQYSAEPSQT
jgi:DNA-binding NtrC family response regulator